jgi:hypothetical protein
MSETLRIRPEGLEWRDVGGQIVVLDLDGGEYFAVNRTGAAVFSSLVEGATREALVDRLTREFEIDAQTAEADLDAFLATAREHRFLEA